MNEYDWDSELKIHRNRKLRAAEQWRWSKAAGASRVQVTGGKLLGQAAATASRTAAAAGQAMGAVRAWVAGSAKPEEECC